MFAYALALVLCVVGTTGQSLNWCPRTTDYAFCPAFDYEDYTVGDCPDGWTCEGEAKVSTYHSLYSGNPFFRIGIDNEIGSATSDYFPVPDGTYDLRWERCGGADDGGVIIQDSQGNTICDVRDGTNTDTFFEQNCVLDGYAGQCIRIYTWDSVSGGWGKTFLRDFQFRDASGGDLESCSTEQRFVAVNTKMTWSDANDYCASEYGTSLATITSDDEATALTAILNSERAWIGLNDLNSEGTWVWASGYECEGDCADLDWWYGNEPNDSNGEDCAERYGWTSWPFLNDVGCDNSRYFICDAHDISEHEVLFSADGPFQPSYGTSIGTVDIRDSMHYEFDIEIHSFPNTHTWSNILYVGENNYNGQMPILFIDEEFNFPMGFRNGAGSSVWSTTTYGDGMLEAGKTYHLEFDWDQNWIRGTINGVVAVDEACDGHAVMEDQPIYISYHASSGWGEADVSVSNILISDSSATASAHYVAIGSTHQIGRMDGGVESYCQNDENNQAAYFSNVHDYDIGVGCCSEDGSTGYRPDCNAHPATYQEAVDLCTANGHRLCTLQEMLSRVTKGKGCWYDAAYNWVSDECQSPVSANAAAAVSGGSASSAIAEEANETNSAGNGSLDWVTTVIGAMIGVVAIGAVVVFLMLMTKKRKRAAEEEKTEMSNAVPEHVVPEMSISSVAVPVTTSGATVEE